MSSSSLAVAFVGCGYIAETHLSALADVPGARLVALCDADQQKAERLSEKKPSVSVYRDLDRMLQSEKPEVVHVLTPVDTHAQVAVAALEAGAHVLVEKPMAADAASARHIDEVARKAGRKVCVGHNRLFDPVMARARSMIDSGALGVIVGAEAVQGFDRTEPGNPFENPQHWTHRLPGGVAQNLAPHPAYLLRAVVGPARKIVVARSRPGVIPGASVEEYRALVEGESALGALSLSLAAKPFATTLTVFGSEATLFLNFSNQTLLLRRPPKGPKLVAKAWENMDTAVQLTMETARTAWWVLRGRMRLYPGLRTLVRRFYESLRDGTEPPVPASEGVEVVELLDALWAQESVAQPAEKRQAG